MKSSRHASFAVPRGAIDALLNAEADAVTIGAFLTLACHTDESGQFSTTGLKAIRERIGINRDRAEKAVRQLAAIHGVVTLQEAAAKPAPRRMPLVYTREQWISKHGGKLPGPEPSRVKVLREDPRIVRYVLPTFDEPLEQRVWIGAGLVHGNDVVKQPLRALKDCGDVAARSLLALYAGQDLDRWYGIPPHGFPWVHYTLQEKVWGACRILLAADRNLVQPTDFHPRVCRLPDCNGGHCFDALEALQHAGLLYESIVVLNRNPIPAKFSIGTPYGNVPKDAEILCDLGIPSPFGPVLEMERGLGRAHEETLEQIAKQQSYPGANVCLDAWGVKTNYKHLAMVATGQPAMICGLFRLRFRVTNPKNAFIQEATRRHREANAAAINRLKYLRTMQKLEPLNSTLQSSSIFLQSLFNDLQSTSIKEYGEESV